MCPSLRVAYVGPTDVREAIERSLDERMTLVSVDPAEPTPSSEVDCVLAVGSLPDWIAVETGPPTIVLTDDEDAANAGRTAGVRVLPTAAADRPAILHAQIEAATTPGRLHAVTEDGRTAWTLERLLEATRDLMAADGEAKVATVAVSAADRVLGLTHTGLHLVDATGDRLEPVAYTDSVEASLGTVPTLERDESLAWEVFESGEDRIIDGVHEESSAHNPETHLRSEMIFSLGDHGVLLIASDSMDAFDDADVYFAKLLAATTTAALDRATRESALSEKNARLEEFVGVVSHDLRNPLTVAEGSVSLARKTGDDAHLEQVSESHRRMREIIEGLLVLAREGKSVGETRPVILGTVAEEAWANVDTGEATLVVGDDRSVHADRNRLTQLFENTFRNSVEHSATSSRPRDDDSAEHAGPDVTVTVEAISGGFVIDDDGPGIPESEREVALEPGYSTDEGTGFGLVIIRNIAEGHGWDLVLAESESGGLRLEITTDETSRPDGEQ
jgi:signal transduction histidine kinase